MLLRKKGLERLDEAMICVIVKRLAGVTSPYEKRGNT